MKIEKLMQCIHENILSFQFREGYLLAELNHEICDFFLEMTKS